MSNNISIDDIDYDLDSSKIQQFPYKNREDAKILNVHNKRIISFNSLIKFIPKNVTLVFNSSTVQKSRIDMKILETNGKVQLLITNIVSDYVVTALLKSNSKNLIGKKLYIDKVLCTVVSKKDDEYTIEISDFKAHSLIHQYGRVPLPPYIDDDPVKYDKYHTVFSNGGFSIAAPTAGLHFTTELIDSLSKEGVISRYINLDVGLGTFKPIATKDISKHKIHSEKYNVSEDVYKSLILDKKNKRKIICVGTTSLRTIETIFATDEPILNGETDLFIKRGYEYKFADGLITNFHAPKSSLLAIIDSLLGDSWREVYEYAQNSNLQFLSFGDSMYIDLDKCKI